MPAPNLLFIMTDQQRYDAVGINGNPIIQTPTLDRLARAGVNLHQYYTNCPVCVPSRCTLFTGRYPHSHRIRENHNLLEADREINLFRVLKHAGFSLGYIGKNHLLEKRELANFDFTDVWGYDHENSPEEEKVHEFSRARSRLMTTEGVWACAAFHDFPGEHTRPYVKASSAIRFLEDRPGDKPFCLCLSFSDPHAPHIALRKYEKMYPLDELQPHPMMEGELDHKHMRFNIKLQASQAHKASEEQRRRFMAVYFGMISWVDEQIGRVLEALRAQGLEENTIVVFTSDHGEFCFDHGMCKKDLVLLDSLLHVPLFIRWPKALRPGNVDQAMIEEVDVMPTLLELMDVDSPFGMQGGSFTDCLRGAATSHKDAVYAEICPPWLYNPFSDYESFVAHWKAEGREHPPFNVPGDYNKSIRTADFRYTWYGDGSEELYDHRTDPHEWHNVVDDPAYADDKMRLKLRLLEWNALSEDPLDPLSIRQLQEKYGDWIGAHVNPGAMAGPYWMDYRYTPNPREL